MMNLFARIEHARAMLAAWLSARGVGPIALLLLGFVIALISVPLIGRGHSWIALPVPFFGLASIAIGNTGAGERGKSLSATFDLIVFASIPFAFALGDPSRALAACFVMFGLIAAGAASLFAASNHGLSRMDRAICLGAFTLACAFPLWFGLVAYVLGIFCFAAAGARIALALTRGAA